jgi:hypothetical protein
MDDLTEMKKKKKICITKWVFCDRKRLESRHCACRARDCLQQREQSLLPWLTLMLRVTSHSMRQPLFSKFNLLRKWIHPNFQSIEEKKKKKKNSK